MEPLTLFARATSSLLLPFILSCLISLLQSDKPFIVFPTYSKFQITYEREGYLYAATLPVYIKQKYLYPHKLIFRPTTSFIPWQLQVLLPSLEGNMILPSLPDAPLAWLIHSTSLANPLPSPLPSNQLMLHLISPRLVPCVTCAPDGTPPEVEEAADKDASQGPSSKNLFFPTTLSESPAGASFLRLTLPKITLTSASPAPTMGKTDSC